MNFKKINKSLIGYDEAYQVPFVYDIYTKNMSFLEVARDLKVLGVKNNKFFLKLYDPDLIGVNPFANNLSKEMVARINNECIRNPWYFLREVSRIPDEGGARGPGAGMPFKLNRGNLAAAWCFLNHIPFYLVIPRQTGKTQSCIALSLYAYLFGTTNTMFSYLNKSQDDANNNLERTKAQRDCLPVYMQQRFIIEDGMVKEAKGKDNVKTLKNATNGNTIVCKPSGATIAKAENIGRGNTTALQLYDEVEFTPNIGYIFSAAGPAYVSASLNAKKNNAMYCRMFITTPGNIDSDPVKQIFPIVQQALKFQEKMYDIKDVDLEDYINKMSSVGIVYIQFNYKQVGKDEEWFQMMCRSIGDKIKIKRELLLCRIRGSFDSPFDLEDLDIINNFKRQPIEQILLANFYILDVYEKIDRNIPYIIGIDCATGSAGDNTAITVINPYTFRPIAEFKSPYQGTVDMVKFIRQLITKIPKGILCIENNSIGIAIIELLKETECYNNLYFDADRTIIGDNTEKLDTHGFLERQAMNRRYYGVNTNTKTRSVMMSILMRHVAEYKDRFVTENIIMDLNNLVKNKSGKILAAPGAHDDSIMSYLIGLFVIYHGKQLYRWGLNKVYSPTDEQMVFERKRKVVENTYEENMAELPDDVKEFFNQDSTTKVNYGFDQKTLDRDLMRAIEEAQSLRNRTTSQGVKIKPNDNDEYYQDDRITFSDGMDDAEFEAFLDELND